MWAITSALTVLEWQAELPVAEVPPERYWHNHERLVEWFEGVEASRKAGDDGYESVPEAPEGMTGNSMTEGLR